MEIQASELFEPQRNNTTEKHTTPTKKKHICIQALHAIARQICNPEKSLQPYSKRGKRETRFWQLLKDKTSREKRENISLERKGGRIAGIFLQKKKKGFCSSKFLNKIGRSNDLKEKYKVIS